VWSATRGVRGVLHTFSRAILKTGVKSVLRRVSWSVRRLISDSMTMILESAVRLDRGQGGSGTSFTELFCDVQRQLFVLFIGFWGSYMLARLYP